MQKKRPVNLNLFTIRFPATAVISILHRCSGVILFCFIVFLLYVLDVSLKSADAFVQIQNCFQTSWTRFVVWVFLSSFILHLLAGVRHFVMDFGFAEEKQSGRWGAYLVMFASAIAIVVLGIYLW